MEIEKLVEELKWSLRKYAPIDIADIYERRHVKMVLDRPIQLDRKRAIATAAKIIADDPTLPDDLAAALMQMCGVSGAKPYEVTNE